MMATVRRIVATDLTHDLGLGPVSRGTAIAAVLAGLALFPAAWLLFALMGMLAV